MVAGRQGDSPADRYRTWHTTLPFLGVADVGYLAGDRIPLIAQAANRMSQAATRPDSAPAERV